MAFDTNDWELMKSLRNSALRSEDTQKDLLSAFNAQTKAIERQNDLQEQANTLQKRANDLQKQTVEALKHITNNTAPKIKHVANDPKQKKAFS